ncbi:MAG: outer membrane lipoprotein carrier protein LolA [Bacilli bacterium]|nr:outer membrane lipoprotein carrier protein LolA [Bacilli bacterium]
MKKIWCFVCAFVLLFITGCGKMEATDVVKEFTDTVNNSKSYVLKGTMEIYSDEDTFTYSVEANYLKDNYYKVLLVNQTNNHEQVILRNGDGVYVITPSLNKSFKFQSEWPDNSSQSYLLRAIVNDLTNDAEVSMETSDSKYVIRSKVNYPNNSDLVYQKITLDKDMNLNKVEVFNNKDAVKIKVNVGSVDLKAGLSEKDFKLEDYVKESESTPDVNNSNNASTNKAEESKESCKDGDASCKTTDRELCDPKDVDCNNKSQTNGSTCEGSNCKTNDKNNTNESNTTKPKDKTTGVLEDIIYPLYIPSNTYLSGKDKVDTDTGERVILTFGGDKNFVLVEEVAMASKEFEIIPVYGDPLMLNDTVAALSENSLYWTSNNVSYYLAGNDLSTEEILNIAKNMNQTTTSVVNNNVKNEK